MKDNFSRIAAGGLSALLLIGAIAAGTAYAGNVVRKNDLIDEQTAEEFAILDAGIESDDITSIFTDLELDNGQYVYEVKFFVGDTEYEYEIRAADGAVIAKEIENNIKVKNNTAETAANTPQSTDSIDQPANADTDDIDDVDDVNDAVEDAIEDAQEKAALTDQTPPETPAETKTDQTADKAPTQGSHPGHISVDEAKKIALEHAGLTLEEVKFSSAKLDNDDGNYNYEIEFYVGQMEYEYEIDADTGTIIDFDSDYDDD